MHGQAGTAVLLHELLVGLCLILTMGPWGIVNAYVSERFPTGVRGSGYGIGYLAAGIVPALYSFYLLGLSAVMPYEYTELVLLVVGGLLLFVGATLGPDTRDVDMGQRFTEQPEVRSSAPEEGAAAPGTLQP